jgi:beta-phosphoglucomutase-like phosphatase (HAD superfamily)
VSGGRNGVRAVIFDFNGTLSDDEPLLYGVYAQIFAEHGRPLSHAEYVDELAGLSDEAIIGGWLGDRPDIDALVAERIRRYCALAGADLIGPGARRAVRYAADRVPAAIVSGATGAEIEWVLEAAGLREAFSVVVGADRVGHGKPDPEGYELALAELGETLAELQASEVVAFEDTEAGIAAAKGAGLACIAVAGTLPRARLTQADAIVEALDQATLARLLG